MDVIKTKTDNEKKGFDCKWNFSVDKIEKTIEKARVEGRHQLLEDEARKVLEAAGIPIAKGGVVHDMESCLETAEELGYPVVLKIVSEDIIHKVDLGGVEVNLENEKEVIDAYQAIHSRIKNRKPDAHIRGISVAEMVEDHIEVVIGGVTDATFGPVVMFGLGGIHVEVFEDVEFRIAPLSLDDAHSMMADIDSFPLLTGSRERSCRDLNALAETISRVGQLMYEINEIKDIDLNPVAALEEGAKALDVAISLK